MRKRIPERTCLGCGTKRPKREMVRIIRTPKGEVEIDLTGKKSGKGAYVCPDQACLSGIIKQKRLERALEVPVPPTLLEELARIIGEKNALLRR